MQHNLEWILDLDILYDASTFDTDPFEPQSNGMRTIFPFWFGTKGRDGRGFVELPYTLPQDFTLCILLREVNIDVWKRKLDWIAEHGGMALINTHPDYMCLNNRNPGLEEYPVRYYIDFLEYAARRYGGQYWHVLPKEMAAYWKKERTEESRRASVEIE